ncbi:MAG TPA: serine/threonine-protein kinase [Polyangiales bacterium]
MEESRSPAQAPRPAPQGPDPLVGRTINGRYRILGIIARGGMGKVYRAEQHPLGRLVALKVLHTNYVGDNDPEFHKRFFLEASIASKLTHPNTVTIFDYGKTDDDIYYIAMELLEGRTLYRALREQGPFSPERTMHIARQICRSLREAHGMGVIHRDLKPANVYLLQHGDEGDVVKVLDFGLVKNLEDKSEDLTQAGLFMGSPKYMSPEQIRGGHCDGRADIYALGVMMFEMLTGKAPYDRPNSVHTLMAHIQEEIPPFREFNPHVRVPAALEAIVRRCMAKSADERFASMDAVLTALKRVSGMHNTLSGELRPVDLEVSRSVELPLYNSRDPASSASHSLPPHELSLLGMPANGQTLVDRPFPGLEHLSGGGGPRSSSRPLSIPASGLSLNLGSRPPLSGSAAPAAGPLLTLSNAPHSEGKARTGRGPFAMGVLAALALGGIAIFVLSGNKPPPAPAASAVKGPQPVVEQLPAEVKPAEVEQKSVLVTLRSTPPGAMVFVGDKEYGPTPTQVEWTGEDATIGRDVTLRFVRRGYQELTVTRQIRGPQLEIEAQTLDPVQPEPVRTTKPIAKPVRAAPPPPPPPQAEPDLRGTPFRASPY